MIRLPRGAGLDRDRVAKHMAALDRYPLGLASYCRAKAVKIDLLVAAIRRDAPLWWAMYAAAHPETVERTCPNCRRAFFPRRANQLLCSRICGAQRRVDVSYFGGRRREAVGFREGECQLCRQRVTSGLSVHHVIGKAQDPRDAVTVALCKGCHLIVGILANRTFAGEPWGWEQLIGFVLLRRAAGRVTGFDVDVEIVAHTDRDVVAKGVSI